MTGQTIAQDGQSFVKELVEARGEHWSDPEVIAKGKLEADVYVRQLERQVEELREDLGKQTKATTLLELLQEGSLEAPTSKPEMLQEEGDTSKNDTSSETSDEDRLKSLVEQTLTQREQSATAEQNKASVAEALRNSYGNEADKAIEAKVKELGVSKNRLMELAAESPSAFMALMGEVSKPVRNLANSSVRTEGSNLKPSGERDFQYYQRLRRENRSAYYEPKIQQQMFEDAKRLGSNFGH